MLYGICTVLWVLFFLLFCFMCASPLMKYNWDVSRSNKQQHGEPLQPRVLLLPHFYFYPSPFSTFPLTFWLSPHNKGLGSPHIKKGQSSRISVISNFRCGRKGRLFSWQVRQLHLHLPACLHIKKTNVWRNNNINNRQSLLRVKQYLGWFCLLVHLFASL